MKSVRIAQLRAQLKNAVLLISIGSLLLFYVNCSFSKSDTTSTPAFHKQSDKLEWIKTIDQIFLGETYKMQLGKLSFTDLQEPVYFQWVSNCDSLCPTVVIANPYAGIDWTGEPGDEKWWRRSGSDVGYMYSDEDGPNYNSGTTPGKLFYQRQTPEQSFQMGALFVPNKVSLLIINNRFYRGRSLKTYVEEFKKVTRYFLEQKKIDSKKMALFGASLGGFIAVQASLDEEINPKALILESPLIDLKNQVNHILDYPNLISDNPVLQKYSDFFEPYLRRVYLFTKGHPVDNAKEYLPYQLETAAKNLKSETMVMHDTWDTLVPFDNSLQFQNQSSSLTQLFLYQHSSGIDWNTFKMDHWQPTEGMSGENAWPWYHLFVYKRILTEDQPKTVYYDYYKLAASINEVKQAKDRGQDISWFKVRLLDLCLPNLTMNDYTSQIPTVTGVQFLQHVMKEIFKFDKPENQICDEVKNFNL